eukprot:2002048-Rhodomonas_salina.1
MLRPDCGHLRPKHFAPPTQTDTDRQRLTDTYRQRQRQTETPPQCSSKSVALTDRGCCAQTTSA